MTYRIPHLLILFALLVFDADDEALLADEATESSATVASLAPTDDLTAENDGEDARLRATLTKHVFSAQEPIIATFHLEPVPGHRAVDDEIVDFPIAVEVLWDPSEPGARQSRDVPIQISGGFAMGNVIPMTVWGSTILGPQSGSHAYLQMKTRDVRVDVARAFDLSLHGRYLLSYSFGYMDQTRTEKRVVGRPMRFTVADGSGVSPEPASTDNTGATSPAEAP